MLNITVEGKELKEIIEKVSAGMLKKIAEPCLGWIILKAENKKLSASVTSIETWLEVNTKHFTVLQDGTIAIDKEDIKVITRMTGDVNIIESNDSIIVKNGKKTITLNKYDVSEYPILEAEDSVDKLKYTESELLETLNNLSTFCSNNENNKMMNVLNFNLAKSRVEALDGYRVGLKKITDDEKLFQDGNVKLHMMVVNDLKKAMSKKSHDIVTIAEGKKYIVITGKDFTYHQRVVEGEYFKVDGMLGSNWDYSFKVNTTEALNHFKYYTDNVIAKSDRVPVVLKISNETIITYGRNARFETSDELSIEDFSGKELTIGFNPYFLVDILKISDADKVLISGNNSKSPIFIEAEKYSFLVLPVNIQDDAMERYLNKVSAA